MDMEEDAINKRKPQWKLECLGKEKVLVLCENLLCTCLYTSRPYNSAVYSDKILQTKVQEK